MLKITSRDNKRLKTARKVRDGHFKNEAIFIEGLRLAKEALKSNLELSDIFLSESFFVNEQNSGFIKEIESFDKRTVLVSDKLFGTITDTSSSQGLIFIAGKPQNSKDKIESNITNNSSEKSQILLLHKINNPSNLGAILRTAEAAGVLGVITTRSSARVFAPKSLRAAMGASFRLPIWENTKFEDVLDWAREQNITTISADVKSDKNYQGVDWGKNYLIVFGSEAHGLSDLERSKIDESVFIPMENDVESLNLAVSCGIILFEAKKTD